ncbi:MAG: FecR domain-containing protein [Novosphingobium sp.]|nr:FecR domain-containing protein [Novosphingobium sp.]MCP5402271.1 FecR domain-containing protein [Novosphingobium sp.]
MMRSLPVRVIGKPAVAVLLVLSLAVAVMAVAAPRVIGIAAAVVKDVRIKGAGAANFSKASVRQRVALADQVHTGAASRLQLLLLDKSKFTVGANARLTIDRFVYDPSGSSSFSASVAKGAFRFMSGRSGRDNNSAIKSPAATIGIRGTVVDGVVGELAAAIARSERAIGRDVESDPETATLVVLRGPGPQTRGGVSVGAADVSAAGVTVNLDRPLQAAYVPRVGAPPIGPFTISMPGLARLGDLILEPQERLLPPPGSTANLPFPRDNLPQPGVFLPPPGAIYNGGGRNDGGFGPGIPGLGSFPELPVDRPTQRTRQTGQAQPSPSPTPTTAPTQTPNPPPTTTNVPPPTTAGSPSPNNPNSPNYPQQPVP